ncbi:MAG TPA: hypothetical protein HA255_06985 [Methanosphaera sp.]|nr:hypothetical protein [Methanosphaera sp.]
MEDIKMTYMKKKVFLVKKTGNLNYTYIKPHSIYTTNNENKHFNQK